MLLHILLLLLLLLVDLVRGLRRCCKVVHGSRCDHSLLLLLLLLLVLLLPVEAETAKSVVSRQLIARILRLLLLHNSCPDDGLRDQFNGLRLRSGCHIRIHLVLVVLVQGVRVGVLVIRVSRVGNNILIGRLHWRRIAEHSSSAVVAESRPTTGSGQAVVGAGGISSGVWGDSDDVSTVK